MELSSRIQKLQSQVIASTWNDCWHVALNEPFWRSEYNNITKATAGGFLNGPNNKSLDELQRLMDCMTWSVGIRDYLHELNQLRRKEGPSGTLLCDNFDQLIDHVLKEYGELKSEYPEYRSKIDGSVGRGIAQFRQGYKFDWKDAHCFFF
eukprot:GHVH01010806.1.p1 GENE.GHVH01010806.1~~GHVH01010806.1.p1  ORF type:complete len:150 (+),score=18.97 GHVH01010806.1:585-1034(+)